MIQVGRREQQHRLSIIPDGVRDGCADIACGVRPGAYDGRIVCGDDGDFYAARSARCAVVVKRDCCENVRADCAAGPCENEWCGVVFADLHCAVVILHFDHRAVRVCGVGGEVDRRAFDKC